MIHSIILWIYTQRLKLGVTIRMFRVWFYVASTRFIWNKIVAPLYFYYESKIINQIENGKVDARDYITPQRLMYYSPPEVHFEDRYDYEHFER